MSKRLMICCAVILKLVLFPSIIVAHSAQETIQNGQHYLKHRKYRRLITEFSKLDLSNLPVEEKQSLSILQGQAFLGLKDFQHAEESFKNALGSNDSNIDALLGLTWSKILKHDLNSASISLGKAAKMSPNNPEILALQGKLETMRGNLSGAAEYYQRAIALDKKNKRARFGLATILMQEKLLDPESETGSILLSTGGHSN